MFNNGEKLGGYNANSYYSNYKTVMNSFSFILQVLMWFISFIQVNYQKNRSSRNIMNSLFYSQ